MSLSVRAAGAGAVLAAVALVASDTCVAQEVVAYAEERPVLDYDAFWAAVPRIKELAKESLKEATDLHDAMEKLSKMENDAVGTKIARKEARELLETYRANRIEYLTLLNAGLKTPAPKDTDLDILKRLRETELIGIHWDKTKFIDCMRDIAAALNVRILIHPDVLKFNTVEASFPRSSADGILRAITSGFDAEFIVYNGEIIVIKTIKRNDKRLQKYLDKHPDWKYWRPEDVKQNVDDDL
jgi:hypothetical protein